MVTFIAALTLGLLGSAHCAGMCGGFYLMAGRSGWAKQAAYVLGKTTTYAVLGGIVGGVGAAAAMFMGAGTVLTLTIGAALVAAGLIWLGVLPQIVTGSPIAQFVARLISKTLERTGRLAPFTLGLANGLLPCGLLYAALGIAATSSGVLGGAGTMAAFGLATLPGLALFGILARKIGDRLLKKAHALGGIAMVAFGVITLMRALQVHSGMIH